MKKKVIIIILIFIILCILYFLKYIPHKKYTDKDFNIETYKSTIDKDNDGIDDQTDILNNAYAYIKTKPKYKSKYYDTGYPNDNYGVCTDVVAFSMLNAGYDLMELVNEDIINNKEKYNIDVVDKNIDFRRDTREISKWQGGDIIIFKKHIGIISNKRNKDGIPLVIHHANPYQINYEEDILKYRLDIIGHYRIS